ncbi:MAG: prepilin-type N-terminal cleavage/methylation domain-containing protein [Elusimicrobiaceae bacterium]|nr:prepilin-type N-terminal cleavage/methylation domain-containing protein [Elusimicrobiaceae bacterium]
MLLKSKRAFTLIELLVVVLIIGILSAIALPQYQKAVEKSKASQALILLRNTANAQKVYFLANGTYARTFSDLGVDIPWIGTEKGSEEDFITDTRSNGKWSIQIRWTSDALSSTYITYLTGKYKGAGFLLYNGHEGEPTSYIVCTERNTQGVRFQGKAGDFCIKIMNGQRYFSGNITTYYLP